MAASKTYMSWTGVSVTPGGGTAIPIDEVTEVTLDRKSDVKRWYADAAIFPKALATVNKTRTLTIKGGNVAALASIPEQTVCTVTAILNDLHNGTGSGSITVTLINAVVTHNPFQGKTNEFGTGDLTFEAFSTDGTTDPITIAVAT